MNHARSRKVLILTQCLHMGGLERMILNLSISLKAKGEWEPQVFVFDRLPDTGPNNDLTPVFKKEGIAVASFVKPPGFSPRVALNVRRRLSSENIRVLHTHDLGALIYGVCAKLLSLGRVRLVHTQHSFVHFSRRWIYKYYERFFARFADEIAVVSPDTRQSYINIGISQRKIHVIPNGVHFPDRGIVRDRDRKENKRDLLGKLDASARAALESFLDCRWLLYMARLFKTKGQNHALELWRSLSPATRSKSVLLFVGPGNEPGQLDKLQAGIKTSPDSSRILYMGTTYSPELWLTSSDLMLSCSEFEGMPLGPIEAAGAGLPLVLSDIPGHEVVKPWSSQYPLSDPAKGARMIEKILEGIEADPDDYFKRTWENAREVRSRYALAQMSDAYSRLYLAEAS